MVLPFTKLVAWQEGILRSGHLKETIYASILRIAAVRVEPLESDEVFLKNRGKNHPMKRVRTD